MSHRNQLARGSLLKVAFLAILFDSPELAIPTLRGDLTTPQVVSGNISEANISSSRL